MEPPEERNRRTDRRYIKFKMKKIKQAKQHGNHGAAQRHATELLQYLGIDGGESPIETVIEETDIPLPHKAAYRTHPE